MATVTSTKSEMGTQAAGPVTIITWAGLTNGDAGTAEGGAMNADRTVQIHGTFGVGGSVAFQGSLDGLNWFPITDPQGNAITKSSAAMEALTEVTAFVRPVVTAGDGTTSITVVLLTRGK